jgi:hypothetical protein
MPVRQMRFVIVNNMAPRNPSVCAACMRPLERGYLHELSTSKRYCRTECYSSASGFGGSGLVMIPFELAVAWPTLTADVMLALFDSAWGDHRG